ncbi:putative ribonuclease H-like domain-containing protein [Tanacetum coccineum]
MGAHYEALASSLSRCQFPAILKVYLYLLVPTGRYVVPTGRVIATVSIIGPYGSNKDLSRSKTFKWYQSLERVSVKNNTLTVLLNFTLTSPSDTFLGSQDREIEVEGVTSYDSRVPAGSYTLSIQLVHASDKVRGRVGCQLADSKKCNLQSDPQQQFTYEDFDQIGQLDLGKYWTSNGNGKQRSGAINFSEVGTFCKREVQGRRGFKDKTTKVEDMEEQASIARDIAGYGDDVAKIDKMNNQVKLEESNARFDKWKESSKNLVKLINSSMSSRSKFGLGYGDTFGSDEVFDLSTPSIFDSCLKDAIEKPLYDWFVKPIGIHAIPPPITGTFMPPSNKPDIDDTQFTYGSKSNNYSESNSVSNDFVSCETSDKSSDSETTGFASCASSVNSSSTMTNASSSVDLKTLHKTDDQGPCNVTQRPFPAGWHNPAAKPMTRPKSHYFQQFSRPGSYNQMDMDGGRWRTAVKTSAGPKSSSDLVIRRMLLGRLRGGTVTFGGGDDKECLVLSKEFQLPDSSQVVLRVLRRHNLYCFNLTDIHSEREIKCLLAKASLDESTKWHRRMAHVNFKNITELSKHGLVNGLPSKLFTNEHNCLPATKESNTRSLLQAILRQHISETLPPPPLSSYVIWTFFGSLLSIRSIDHKHYSLWLQMTLAV